MTPYKSASGKTSGVLAFKIAAKSILVRFYTGPDYLYTHSSAGISKIEKMKELALAQHGLSTFISQEKPKYKRKIPRT
jgi:hypothetical protein